jgi:hypothetical protein
MQQPFKNLFLDLKNNEAELREKARREKVLREVNRFFSELNNSRPYSESTVGFLENIKEVQKRIPTSFINL